VIELLKQAVEEVFVEHFGMPAEPCDEKPSEEGYTAQIPVSDGRKAFIAQLWADEATLKRLAEILLFEENPDEETLRDLTAEVANFIVGHAKMVASDRHLPYSMETPKFTGKKSLDGWRDGLIYRVGDHWIALHLKERNG